MENTAALPETRPSEVRGLHSKVDSYLLVTAIPFARAPSGTVIVDALWLRDLEGLGDAARHITVLAPQVEPDGKTQHWSGGTEELDAHSQFSFVGIPVPRFRGDWWRWRQLRAVIRHEVSQASLVHTSNPFPPHMGLMYAHDYAVKTGKKTIFVVAEDYFDMLDWEWVRTAEGAFERTKRRLMLSYVDRRARKSAATASMTFLNGPAALLRLHSYARQAIAIRHPIHEAGDVISERSMESKCTDILRGDPLQIATACRHRELKGLDYLIRAIALLNDRGVYVTARMYGQGDLTDHLKDLAETLGLEKQVLFPGRVPPGPNLYRELGQAHISLMPHRTNDFGRSFFDAMAAGTPVIAYRTAGSSGTVRDEVDGLLVPLDDIQGLAAAIERCDKDRELLVRLATAARERALANTRSDWFGFRASWTRELFAMADSPSRRLQAS